MPGKNIIVRMADRLRAGKTNETERVAKQTASESFASRQHILARLAKRLSERIAADARFAEIRCVVRPDSERPERIMLVRNERVVTVRISPDTEYFSVGGFGLGKLFSANPAHLQSDDIVLLVADVSSITPFGTEVTAVDILADLAS
jgi:uncharacterized protein (DUF4415 family)